MTHELTPQLLQRLVAYDPETGLMTWLKRSPDLFAGSGTGGSIGACNRWNALFSGKKCFSTDSGRGYLRGVIFDKPMYAHRVAWTVHYGEFPENEIDHINGVRSDNRIENLRDIPRQLNARNQQIHSRNSSGVCGVSWKSKRKRWEASVGNKYVGCFDRFPDAVAAREAAAQSLNYHENHGRKAT